MLDDILSDLILREFKRDVGFTQLRKDRKLGMHITFDFTHKFQEDFGFNQRVLGVELLLYAPTNFVQAYEKFFGDVSLAQNWYTIGCIQKFFRDFGPYLFLSQYPLENWWKPLEITDEIALGLKHARKSGYQKA